MKLVEAEAEGPIEGEDAVVTPPRPPHRRVSISLLFTLTVLTGTVVAIYMAFPARKNVMLTEAIAQHRETEPWDLVRPTLAELRAWSTGVVGKDAPLPRADGAAGSGQVPRADGSAGAPALSVLGARAIEVLDRRAAVIRFAIGDDEVTYVVQHNRGIAPAHSERVDGDVKAVEWRRGKYISVAVGPGATAARWLAQVAPGGS